jgi:regulator of RNase E activity RraA
VVLEPLPTAELADAAGASRLSAFPSSPPEACRRPLRARARRGELEVSVVSGGLEVRPGDLVYGDADGVVVVPYERHDEIVSRVRTS